MVDFFVKVTKNGHIFLDYARIRKCLKFLGHGICIDS
ncbi:hypothetical protein KSS87_022221 [Heliosperma pusillum]|nr:hypothetical protein KSS87_022221 [Heliosperma pusillum]